MSPYLLVVLFYSAQLHPYARSFPTYESCEDGRAEAVQLLGQSLLIRSALCRPAPRG